MRSELAAGLTSSFTYRVPPTKTVRHIYTESETFASFPEVFATGFFVALVEWACVECLHPYLDPGEGSLGIAVSISHEAATPPGFDITVDATVVAVIGRQVSWEVSAHDGVDTIGRGTHTRAVIDRVKFDARIRDKIARSRGDG